MTFRNWLQRNFFPSAYEDLEELFLYIWWKIHRDGNTLHLIKIKWFQREFFRSYTDRIWRKLRADYINRFGISKHYSKYLGLIGAMQAHKVDLATTKNRWHISQIMIIEETLNEIENKESPLDEYETLVDVQMTLGGISIDPRQESVVGYRSKENKAIKISKKQRALNMGRKPSKKRRK